MPTTDRKYKIGDRVTPDPAAPNVPAATIGRIFKVTKVNPVNIQAEAEDGGRGINYPASILLPADQAPTGPAATVLGRPFEPIEFFTLGEIVTFTPGSAPKGYTDTSPFVAYKDDGKKVNVTPLGGAEDRYWRANRRILVKRDLAWLTEQLGAKS